MLERLTIDARVADGPTVRGGRRGAHRLEIVADHLEALAKQHRYAEATGLYARHAEAIERSASKAATRAIAIALRCLQRSGERDVALALLERLPTSMRHRFAIAEVGHDVLVLVDPCAAFALTQAVAPSSRHEAVRCLEMGAVAMLRAGTCPVEVAERTRSEAAAAGLGSDVPRLAALDAALASTAGDHATVRRSLRALFASSGFVPPTCPGEGGVTSTTFRVHEPDPLPPVDTLVTVVMSVYRAADTIDTSLAAVLGQSHQHLDVIVVDDASDDDSSRVVEAWMKRDDRVRLIRSDVNAGPYACRNLALQHARGRYVATHDADDWSHPHRLRWQLHAIQRGRALGCATGWVRVDDSGRLELRADGSVIREDLSSYVYDRRVFDALGGFDVVRVSGDAEFRSRVVAGFGRAAIVRAPMRLASLGRWHASTLTRAGPTAYDAFGFNPQRAAYWAAARAWHERCRSNGRLPYLDPAAPRPFAAPEAVVSTAPSMGT